MHIKIICIYCFYDDFFSAFGLMGIDLPKGALIYGDKELSIHLRMIYKNLKRSN